MRKNPTTPNPLTPEERNQIHESAKRKERKLRNPGPLADYANMCLGLSLSADASETAVAACQELLRSIERVRASMQRLVEAYAPEKKEPRGKRAL